MYHNKILDFVDKKMTFKDMLANMFDDFEE